MDLSKFFFKYETHIHIQLNMKAAGCIYRALQISLSIGIAYLIITSACWNAEDRGISSVYSNVEGVDNLADGLVFDAIDFVKPSQEKDAFFITTKLFITNQVQASCTDNPDKGNNRCTRDQDCIKGRKSKNGINTGKCIVSSGLCQIKGWCPVEKNESNSTVIYRLSDIDNFTVYVRDNIEFFAFQKCWSNFNFSNKNSTCLYDEIKSPLCPIFSIKFILDKMNISFKDVKEKGAIIGFFIEWTCYFNGYSEPCTIKYSFKRLGKDKNGAYVGYKFKYADYHHYENKRYRTKVTARGLRFLVIVGSTGYKIDPFVFIYSIGSLLSYFGTLSAVAYFTFFYIFRCFTEKQKKLLMHDESNKVILSKPRVIYDIYDNHLINQ